MESIIEVVNTIMKCLTGKEGWRVWIALCVVAWLVVIFEPIRYVLYAAIFCSIMVFLIVISWCKSLYDTNKKKKIEEKLQNERERAKKSEREAQEFQYKNNIWRFFVTVDTAKLDNALYILDNCTTIANNPESRFVSNKELDNENLASKIGRAVCDMTIIYNNGISYHRLIEEENLQDGRFLNFEPYFYALLEHYKHTGKREFV
jgi:H+/gluconate symporter-like permease